MNLLSYWFCKNSRKSGISKKNYRHHGKKNRCNCADNLSFCLKPFCLKYVKFDKINPKLFSFIDKAINANDTHRFIVVLTRFFLFLTFWTSSTICYRRHCWLWNPYLYYWWDPYLYYWWNSYLYYWWNPYLYYTVQTFRLAIDFKLLRTKSEVF